MSTAFKNRTRDKIIAAFRESIRRKHEWEEQAQDDFKRIREDRRLLFKGMNLHLFGNIRAED